MYSLETRQEAPKYMRFLTRESCSVYAVVAVLERSLDPVEASKIISLGVHSIA